MFKNFSKELDKKDNIKNNIMSKLADDNNIKTNSEVIETSNTINEEYLTIVQAESRNENTKLVDRFRHIKNQYIELFKKCSNIDDVLRLYIKNTNDEQYFDELRLRYINMYLFNSRLVQNKISTEELKLKITQMVYAEVFDSNMSLKELIGSYINLTSRENLFDEIRLRYLSMYLFSKGITKDRWIICQAQYYIQMCLDTTKIYLDIENYKKIE
ncbi:MAG: hypothetical protein KAX49_03530 [Halanaerobiales bacterium]|nr:hypothetical protein [Halanaerobiales bacterium]